MTPKEKEVCREAAKLIDDLCSAYRITLLPDDQQTRNKLERIGNEN